ncbi:MAG: hypothetical protein HIU92_14475 [Proteobacteria bacterium]|nr:hypothetical protein [Pseudomonadota bacterium]
MIMHAADSLFDEAPPAAEAGGSALNRPGRGLRNAGLALAGIGLGTLLSLPAFAQEAGGGPDHFFFGGLGAGYNNVDFGTQNIFAVGTSDNYSDGALVSSGTAAGPGTVSLSSPSTGSPNVQLGYVQHFGASPWLWGGKFAYTDLLASTSAANVGIPQAGAYTYTVSQEVVPFTGVAVVNSYETKANNRFSLMPFVGRSYGEGFVYVGAGATLTQTQTDLNGLVGYAVINGVNTNVSGAPQNFSSAGWVLGGAIDVGATYFINPTWFIDVDYTLAKTASQVGNYASNFVNSTTNPGVTTVGTLVGASGENVVTNSVTITINKTF